MPFQPPELYPPPTPEPILGRDYYSPEQLLWLTVAQAALADCGGVSSTSASGGDSPSGSSHSSLSSSVRLSTWIRTQ